MKYMQDTFLHKKVIIYPRDTEPKKGVIMDMNEYGVAFELHNALVFYAWHNMTFLLLKDNS